MTLTFMWLMMRQSGDRCWSTDVSGGICGCVGLVIPNVLKKSAFAKNIGM